MKAWLKGGLIGAGLFIAYLLITLTLPTREGEVLYGIFFMISIIISIPILPLSIIGLPLTLLSFKLGVPWLSVVSGYIIFIVGYFIWGAIIGLIIQKVKQRKKLTTINL